MRQPRVRIDDLTDGVTEMTDDQLDLIVGGMVNDDEGGASSLFDWDLFSYGFGLGGGGGSGGGGGGTPAPAPAPTSASCTPSQQPQVFYYDTPGHHCTRAIRFTTADAGVGAIDLYGT